MASARLRRMTLSINKPSQRLIIIPGRSSIRTLRAFIASPSSAMTRISDAKEHGARWQTVAESACVLRGDSGFEYSIAAVPARQAGTAAERLHFDLDVRWRGTYTECSRSAGDMPPRCYGEGWTGRFVRLILPYEERRRMREGEIVPSFLGVRGGSRGH